jgi:hypothetical protein
MQNKFSLYASRGFMGLWKHIVGHCLALNMDGFDYPKSSSSCFRPELASRKLIMGHGERKTLENYSGLSENSQLVVAGQLVSLLFLIIQHF